MKGISKLTLKERLEYYSKQAENGCIEWTGGIENTGYAHIRFHGNRLYVHRASWIAHHGEIPKGKLVLHKCDNRKCLNPEHLFLGTQKDNQADMTRKGRGRYGTRNGRATLTDEQVMKIRDFAPHVPLIKITPWKAYRLIGELYGVGANAIYDIIKGNKWKHLEDLWHEN